MKAFITHQIEKRGLSAATDAGSVSSMNPSVPPKVPMSWWKAVVLHVAIVVLFGLIVGLFDEKLGRGIGTLLSLALGIWAQRDAKGINLQNYKTRLPVRGMGVFMFFLWFVAFPWYLVMRSRIKAGVMPKLEHVGPTPSGSVLRIVGSVVAVFAVIALGSAALFMSAGSSVKGLWTDPASKAEQSEAMRSASAPIEPQVSANLAVPISGTYVYKNEQGFGEMAVRTDSDGVYLKIVATNTAHPLRSCEFETDGDTGKAQRNGSTVTWSGDRFGQCKLKMKFSGSQAEVEQEGECGCGIGVSMDGTFTTDK